jgi:hypothetical protein
MARVTMPQPMRISTIFSGTRAAAISSLAGYPVGSVERGSSAVVKVIGRLSADSNWPASVDSWTPTFSRANVVSEDISHPVGWDHMPQEHG